MGRAGDNRGRGSRRASLGSAGRGSGPPSSWRSWLSLAPAPPATAAVTFEQITLPTATGKPFTSLAIGPDQKLYAATLEGEIVRFPLSANGTTGTAEVITSLQAANGGSQRMLIGLAFDPASTAGNLVLWVTHSAYAFTGGPDWTGKLTRMSGPNLATVQDYVVGLPRSARDHVTNSLTFGADGAIYFLQGSNTGVGGPETVWENRPERKLTAAVLRVDPAAISFTAPGRQDRGGRHVRSFRPPRAADDPCERASKRVRPRMAHERAALRPHERVESRRQHSGFAHAAAGFVPQPNRFRHERPLYGAPGPWAHQFTQSQNDYLNRVVQNGYYGHPNPQRCEWVLNGGNPTAGGDPAEVPAYPVGTQPDRNWRGFAFDFGLHRSANGVIEYKKDTFGGALQGKLLVVRYSQGDDIIVLTPGPPNGDIVSSQTGIAGFTGFADPLDLVEHPAKGYVYVSELGAQRIRLLRPVDGYARPKGATPTNVRLVPAFTQCTTPNGDHGAPLASPSCNPPVAESTELTVGSPDANGEPANSTGLVILKEVGESPVDPDNGDQADVLLTVELTDVRKQSDLSDYSGELEAVLPLRITDRQNGAAQDQPGTATDLPFSFTIACTPTPGGDSIGSNCNASTSVDAVMSGAAREGKRSIWELGQVEVFDGGPDGIVATPGNSLFQVQGLYAP